MKSLTSINITFGLLNIPGRVYPIRDTKKDAVNFVGLSNCCQHETGLKRYCKSCLNSLEWKTDLKGYKIGRKEYIKLSKTELDTIEKLDNGIEILYFTKTENIDIGTMDKPYFIEPTANNKLYALFNSLFAQLNLYAICRATIKGSEHFGVLRNDKIGLILQMIERTTSINIDLKRANYSNEEEKQLKLIIEQNIKDFDFSGLTNSYAEKVRKLIEAKAEGKDIEIVAIESRITKEDDLLDTLKSMQIIQR